VTVYRGGFLGDLCSVIYRYGLKSSPSTSEEGWDTQPTAMILVAHGSIPGSNGLVGVAYFWG
jgi:hypothetical protein